MEILRKAAFQSQWMMFIATSTDLVIRDGYVYVPVLKLAPAKQTVKLNIYNEPDHVQVAEPAVEIEADVTQLTQEFVEGYIPEGYMFIATSTDLVIRDGYVYVPVLKLAAMKTLKIYWAIDNPDGAAWATYNNGEPWTETIAWTDRENTFVMPALNVKDGYKLAGWSVSGMQGNYWDANTQTFGLTGLIVEDAEGGYVAITANVVVKTYTVTYTDGMNGTVFPSQINNALPAGAATPAFFGTPRRSGYVFVGWTPSVSATVTGDAVYTAVWQQIVNDSDVPKTSDNLYPMQLVSLIGSAVFLSIAAFSGARYRRLRKGR